MLCFNTPLAKICMSAYCLSYAFTVSLSSSPQRTLCTAHFSSRQELADLVTGIACVSVCICMCACARYPSLSTQFVLTVSYSLTNTLPNLVTSQCQFHVTSPPPPPPGAPGPTPASLPARPYSSPTCFRTLLWWSRLWRTGTMMCPWR